MYNLVALKNHSVYEAEVGGSRVPTKLWFQIKTE